MVLCVATDAILCMCSCNYRSSDEYSMSKNKRGTGLNPHNETVSELNKVSAVKTRLTVRLNDEWRKLCEEDPTLPYRISFPEWRKKQRWKK